MSTDLVPQRWTEGAPIRNGSARLPAEQRAPRAATQNLRWVTAGLAQPPDWNAHHAFELAYYQNIVIYACVRLAANTIASLPFRVGADPTHPNDYDPTATLARLLGPPPGGPAPKLSARRLWAWTVAQRIVTGRNAWEIDTGGLSVGSTPVALWPLASSALKAVKSLGGVEWFDSFSYGRPGDERKLAPDQVVYDWDPSGTDFREPESPLRSASLDVSVAVMQSRYDYAFLKNDARPPAIVVTEEFEDQDAYEAFKSQWHGAYGGPDNAGRLAFVESKGGPDGVKGAVDVTVLGISPKDAQAAQRHTAAMERCAIALGTPWSLLDASGRTYDNASQEWRNYVQHTIGPKLADFADMVNMQLAPLFPGNLVGWFDTSSLGILPMDRLDATGVATLVGAEVITKNEGRAPFGLMPVDGGDEFVTPAEPTTVKPIAVAAEAPVGEERKLHDYKGEGGPCAVCGKPARHTAHGYFVPAPRAVPELEAREPYPAQAPTSSQDRLPDPVEIEARRARLWTTTNGRIRNLERGWERTMRRLFARQARSAVARLEGKRGRTLASRGDMRVLAGEVFDPQHWLADTADDVTALYEQVAAAGGARVSDMLGIAFDVEAPYAQDFIRARANQLAGQVTQTTYEAIQATLADGAHAGEGIPELAARVRHVFDVASETRATTIARTEVISAFNGSAALTAAQSGSDVVAGQQWIATRDNRVRESHAEIDGAIVGIGEAFDNGLAYPGDPAGDPGEVVNCRCTLAFLTPEDMANEGQGRARMVEVRLAKALLALVAPGQDEQTWREALRVAA